MLRFYLFFQWLTTSVIALVITVIVKHFIIEAYRIPSSSMERSLYSGDYLFVSKLAYGPRVPMTPVSIPLLPPMLSNGKITYKTSRQIKYKRLKGFSKIQRNDIIVFNFPEGDTVIINHPEQNYYSLMREYGREYSLSSLKVLTHPVDKREHFVKRCIGLPGDTIQIIKSEIFINNELFNDTETAIIKYFVRTRNNRLDNAILIDLDIDPDAISYNPSNNIHIIPMHYHAFEKLQKNPEVRFIEKYSEPSLIYRNPEIFPHQSNNFWSPENFGPLLIPSKNTVIKLNLETLALYERIISKSAKDRPTGRATIRRIKNDQL